MLLWYVSFFVGPHYTVMAMAVFFGHSDRAFNYSDRNQPNLPGSSLSQRCRCGIHWWYHVVDVLYIAPHVVGKKMQESPNLTASQTNYSLSVIL